MRVFLFFIFSVYLFFLSSCKKYQEATPSFFLKSNVISVSPPSQKEGSESHRITDLWLYVNGQYQGTYPLGKLMPITSNNKNVRINIFAGIKNNGIADTRIFYPFFDFLTFDTLVKAGTTIERNFTFAYKASTTFTWTENFDNIDIAGRSLENDSRFDGEMDTAAPDDSFEGKSLKVTLPANGIKARIVTSRSEGYFLPTGTSNVYLELDYKCDTPFTVGVTSSDGTQNSPAMVINPQENWNKIYIQLSTAVNVLVTNNYKVYFEFSKPLSDAKSKQLFLDNIKLIYL